MKLLILTVLALLVLQCWTQQVTADDKNVETPKTDQNVLTSTVEILRKEMKTLASIVQEQTSEIRKLKRELAVIKYNNNIVMANNTSLQATVDTVFLATISVEEYSISDEEPIIWDSAPINPGDHYNPILEAYTAPYHGYYQFSVTKRSNENRAYFWLLLDDQRYSLYQLYSSGTVAGSATIVLELTAGQIVRVENSISTIIYGTDSSGTIRSWFTGHMLHAL